MSIEDVTTRVNEAVKPGRPRPTPTRRDASSSGDRKGVVGIKPGCEVTWLRCIKGRSINLYRYKRYTDVRLVFAPEQQAAFMGRP